MLYPLLCKAAGKYVQDLKQLEINILEAQLFMLICEHLKCEYEQVFKKYYDLLSFSLQVEEHMIDKELIRCVIKDILASEEYTLEGISYYTKTPLDVFYDILSGCIDDPSSTVFREVIKLHLSVRPELYQTIFNKITQAPNLPT